MYTKNYVVGQEFPIEVYRNAMGSVAILTIACFNAAFFTQGVSFPDIRLFRSGSFRYGVFIREFIPFIIFQVGTDFIFEMTLNLAGLPEETTEKWLNDPPANAVHMFLIDQPTYLLSAIRLVGLDLGFMKTLKDTLKSQVSRYRTSEEVVVKIKSIEDEFSSTTMILHTHFYKHEEVGK